MKKRSQMSRTESQQLRPENRPIIHWVKNIRGCILRLSWTNDREDEAEMEARDKAVESIILTRY